MLPGWRWTLTEDRWPDGLAALRTYVHRHGTARIPHDTVVDGFPLGHWVATRRAQRKRNALTPAQVRTLAALPGWVWEIRQTRWEQGLRLLTAYAERTGAPNPNSFYVEATEDNFTLGAWAMSRRREYRRGVLAADRIRLWKRYPAGNGHPTTPHGNGTINCCDRLSSSRAASRTSANVPSSTEYLSGTGS